MKETEELIMRFDPRTIEHLGIQMYSRLPPVLAELISNSYDAEATEVAVKLYDSDTTNKSIVVKDNGHGMSFDEVNNKFLRIGRNRRDEESSQMSKNEIREVIGKKGLGKLAFFGIAEHIKIETTSEKKKTIFEMDWRKVKTLRAEESGDYKPDLLLREEYSDDNEDGTIVTLTGLKRKSPFDIENLAYNLSSTFQVFDEKDFNTVISLNDDKKISVTNELKYSKLKEFFSWKIPEDLSAETFSTFPISKSLGGKIIASTDTIPMAMRGVALFARGKLVNDYSFLDVKATSHGYSYITGWINVDFIELFENDVISTNRQSLNWEIEETNDLKCTLEEIYKAFFNEQRDKRKEEKIKEIENTTSIRIDPWIESLPKHERKLAKKLVGSIIDSDGLSIEKTGELIKFTRDSFQFEAFKELAAELQETELTDSDKVLDFFKEWQIIEAKELYKIAQIRIETIEKFKWHIDNNSREVPEVHNFLAKFPWLLDPRIMSFREELTYSSLLRENFTEDDSIEESDRRIDFLCQSFADSFFIIELKRPKKRIGKTELMQALDYVSFLEERMGNEYGKKTYCYIIGEKLINTAPTKKLAEGLKNNNDVFFKSYDELLSGARGYHQEFIDKYNELQPSSSE